MKNLIITYTLLLLSISCLSQELTLIKKEYGRFYEEYLVLKADTSIKNGGYHKLYKGQVIEKGQYQNNLKTGKWLYFSLDAIFEYEYNYDTKSFVKISGKDRAEDYLQTPVCFNGSPIIPYLYMVKNIRYPIEAKKYDIGGKITLVMQINRKGEISSFYLSQKLHPLMDKEVIRVAKTFPQDWTWIPARYNNQNIDGEYAIDIEFELAP